MMKHTWSTTRFRRVSSVAAIALASLAAVSCGDDPAGPGGAITNVEVEAFPSGTSTENMPRGATVQLVAAPENAGGFFTPATVTWSSSNTAVATVDANGLVTTVAGGETWIRGQVGGVGDSVKVTVQFPVATVTVESDTLEIRQEGTANLTVTLVDTQGDTVTGRNIQFITLNETVAGVNDDGVVNGIADGTVTIQVTSEGVVQTIDIVVNGVPLVETVEVDAPVTFGAPTQTFTATHESKAPSGADIAGTTATWSSSNTAVATVDPVTGLVTLVGEGTANIRADVDNGDGVNVRGQLAIRVAPALVSGVAQGTGTIPSGTSRFWALIIPPGTTAISVTTSGGSSGDGDLFLLRAGINPPTPPGGGYGTIPPILCGTSGGCYSAAFGNAESISRSGANVPPAGTYPIAYHAWNGDADVVDATIVATITP